MYLGSPGRHTTALVALISERFGSRLTICSNRRSVSHFRGGLSIPREE